MRGKDFLVIVGLLWFLGRYKETVDVNLDFGSGLGCGNCAGDCAKCKGH